MSVQAGRKVDLRSVPQCVSCSAYTEWGDSHCWSCGETFGVEADAEYWLQPLQEDER